MRAKTENSTRGRRTLRLNLPGFASTLIATQQKDFMSQAMMDPEQVRRFAEELQRFTRDLQNRMGSLQARFSALGDTWQDQEHAKFADEFKQTSKAFKKFVELSDQHVPFLLRKAQRIEEYLNQR